VAKTALLFAGQGAQYVGMGRDLTDAFNAARQVFERADRALGFAISKLCFEGPADELNSTENSQPAVLTVGIACLRALESLGRLPGPAAAGGLSLGEYCAHVAAGSLGEEDAVRLVRRRGELMRDSGLARPGGMASVLGLSRELVEEACREAAALGVVAPANFNSPGQVVISGEFAALERASELAKEKGAKRVVRLKVSGGFHTELMRPAREGLAQAMEKVEIGEPRFAVVANATADYVKGPEDVRRTLLDQITRPVLFQDCVRRLVADGIHSFVELGPGRVLAGLVRRIAPEVEVTSLGTAEALKSFVPAMEAEG
jgi:[acyl-carrier-protein] S-malonyltransferase